MHDQLIKHYQHQDSIDWQSNELHPLLKRVYINRQVTSSQELEYELSKLLPYQSFKQIDEAVSVVIEAIRAQQKILIIGDFDADGATSTALAMRILRMLGAQQVDYLVPNRFDFGYGLTPEIVDVALEDKPDLIITVDNGIASINGVAHAKSSGIRVVVTDHHLAADQLPSADAIVNPNQPGCDFPSKAVAGVGVIFYLMMAVRARLREQGWFNEQRPEPNLASVLDLVALGTVADVVSLDVNNRILVEQGIRRIRAGQCCVGITALLNVAGRNQQRCVATDLGFAVGPRLNAAGRLEDMALGIECLLTDDEQTAREIAGRLDGLNHERKSIEQGMLQQAMQSLEPIISSLEHQPLPAAISLFQQEWHQGVIGILAARVKEKLHRPVIAFADAGNDEIKGSARSIKGLHIRDALDLVDKRQPGLIHKFGGHAMAAGLTIQTNAFNAFKAAFEQVAAEMLSDQDLQGVIYSDGELQAEQFHLELAELIRTAGPWGQHFPEPLFDNYFSVVEWRIVAEKHLKLRLQLDQSDRVLDAIAFNTLEDRLGTGKDRIRAVYKLDVNEFRNKKTLQLLIEYLEPA